MSFYCTFGQLLKEREREVVLGFRNTPATSVSSTESESYRHELSAIAANAESCVYKTSKVGGKNWLAVQNGGHALRAN